MSKEIIPDQQSAEADPIFSDPTLNSAVEHFEKGFFKNEEWYDWRFYKYWVLSLRSYFEGFGEPGSVIVKDGFDKIILEYAETNTFREEELIHEIRVQVKTRKESFLFRLKNMFYELLSIGLPYYGPIDYGSFILEKFSPLTDERLYPGPISTESAFEYFDNKFEEYLEELVQEVRTTLIQRNSKSGHENGNQWVLEKTDLTGAIQNPVAQWLDRDNLKGRIKWLGNDAQISVLFQWLFEKDCIFHKWAQLAAAGKSEIPFSSKIEWRKPDNQLAVLLQMLVGAKKSWIEAEWVQIARANFGKPNSKPIAKNLTQLAQSKSKILIAWGNAISKELWPKLDQARG